MLCIALLSTRTSHLVAFVDWAEQSCPKTIFKGWWNYRCQTADAAPILYRGLARGPEETRSVLKIPKGKKNLDRYRLQKTAYFTNKYLSIWGHMKAQVLPFHMGTVAPFAKGSDWVRDQNLELLWYTPEPLKNRFEKYLFGYKKFKNFGSADSPESPLQDEVWKPTQLWEMA